MRRVLFGVWVFLAAPLLCVAELASRRRLARRLAGTVALGPGDAELAGEDLVLRPSDHARGVRSPRVLPLATVQRVELLHLEGDGGFADANTLHYLLFVWLTDASTLCIALSESHPFPLEDRLFLPLRERGVLDRVERIAGPSSGMARVALWSCGLLASAAYAGLARLTSAGVALAVGALVLVSVLVPRWFRRGVH